MPFWDSLYSKFKTWWGSLFPSGAANREFDVTTAIPQQMQGDIALWYNLYLGEPPWKTHDVISLNLPASICREMVRPTLSEFQVSIEGGAMAKYLTEQFRNARPQLSPALEVFLALGGGALKPYRFQDKIIVQYCDMRTFQPTKFNSAGECVGGVFKEVIKSGTKWYARLENHKFEDEQYIIENKAFESSQSGSIGNPVDLHSVPEWADVQEEDVLDHVERPLFAYFKTPIANKVDPSSGVGVSMYADAIELIRQADVQWEQLQWEFASGERKVLGEYSQVNMDRFRHDRLYKLGPWHDDATGSFFYEWSPDFRDSNLYAGFQNILKQIEFNVGLSFGTISDPMSVDRTATEVRITKQRMFTTIEGIKGSFEKTLDNLIYAMSVYASLYGLAPAGDYTVAFEWGDSILEDPDTKRQDMIFDLQLVSDDIMGRKEFRMKHFGETEEQALAMLPTLEEEVDEGQDEVE